MPKTRKITLAGSMIVIVATAAAAYVQSDWLRSLAVSMFGPEPVVAREAYQDQTDGPKFDHAVFDQLLSRHVDPGGWVDYTGFKKDQAALDEYLATLADALFEELDRNEKLALLLNAYNAFTIRLILEHMPVDSIKDIPAAERWEAVRWRVGKHTWSLNQIEHEQIRPKFKEPLIHFALVCAASSCPPLRAEAYNARKLDKQLTEQAEYVHTHDRWLRIDAGRNEVHLTELYKWYGSDFTQTGPTVLDFAAQYNATLAKMLRDGPRPARRWIPYQWALNSIENRPDKDNPSDG